MYTLKQGVQGFTVIDGPMAGRSFKSGMSYKEIPPQEAAKFVMTPDEGELAKPEAKAELSQERSDAGKKNK
jgi:hypothetical protein